MSTTDERLIIQTRMLIDEVISANNAAHENMRESQARESRALVTLVQKHTKKWSALAAAVTFVGIALPVYSQIRTASATAQTVEVAKEATRQEFLKLQQSRELELERVADRAADRAATKAVRMVTVPQDTIRSER